MLDVCGGSRVLPGKWDKSDCSQKIQNFQQEVDPKHWSASCSYGLIKAFWKLPMRKKICRTWWTHEKTAEFSKRRYNKKVWNFQSCFPGAYKDLCAEEHGGRVVPQGEEKSVWDKNYELSGNGNGGGMNLWAFFSVSRICLNELVSPKSWLTDVLKGLAPCTERCSGSVT